MADISQESIMGRKRVLPSKEFIEKYCKNCFYYRQKDRVSDMLGEIFEDGSGKFDLATCYYYCWRRGRKGKVVHTEPFLSWR